MGQPASLIRYLSGKRADRYFMAAVLAFGMGESLYAQGEPPVDLEQIRQKAEQQSDPDAQNSLGNAYTNGLGVKQDFAQAFAWYRRAAENGFAPAQFNLGLVYEIGRGVKADERQAFKYYLMAAEQGFAPAQFNVGNMYSAGRGVGQDYFEANLWYKQAAEKGVVEAQYNLGLAYETGRGVRKDETQAARWYKQAADRGYSRAQYNLGLLLESGRGVAANEAAAATYYRSAADQGLGIAQNNLGVMLADGRGGLAKDPVQAFYWLSLAVKNGAKPDARDFLARTLSAGQQATVEQMLAKQASGQPVPTVAAQSASSDPAPEVVRTAVGVASVPDTSANPARLAELTEALAKARQANSLYAEENQRLELAKARLEQELTQGGDGGKLIEQLREQSRRLASQVQNLATDKEVAERQISVLAAQVKDFQDELKQAKTAGGPAANSSSDASRLAAEMTTLTGKLNEALGAQKRLEQANQVLTENNAALFQEKEKLATTAKMTAIAASGSGREALTPGEKDAIVANLQSDNARLNDEVKRSTMELLSLNQQIRSLQSDLEKRNGPAPKIGADDNLASAALRSQNRAVASNNTRLQDQRDAAVSDAANVMDQLKSARTEITRLNETIRGLQATRQSSDAANDQLGKYKSQLDQAAQETARLQSENQQLMGKVAALQNAPKPRSADETLAPQLAQAQQSLLQLQQQVAGLQNEKTELTKRFQALEQSVQESATLAQKADAQRNTIQQELAQANDRVATIAAKLAAQESARQALAEENRTLGERAARAEETLAGQNKRMSNTADLDSLKSQLAGAQDRVEQLTRANAALTAKTSEGQNEVDQAKNRVVELQNELTKLRGENADLMVVRLKFDQQAKENENFSALLASNRRDREQAESRVGELEKQLALASVHSERGSDLTEKLKSELADANRSVEKLNSAVAELTVENERLGKQAAANVRSAKETAGMQDELVRLRRESGTLAGLRDENTRLRPLADEAVALRAKLDEQGRAGEKLAGLMATSRREQEQAQARVVELQKQVEEARTIRIRGGDDTQKLQADLAAANLSLDKLNATVAELTGVNDRLEKDLENARKSTAAALAAQSQAVNAAQGDAYKVEISTLQARVKELETRNEVERSHAAQEVGTLAEQLQRVRETNKSLTDANRALLGAKQAEMPTVNKDEFDQLQAKVRDLTAGSSEMRRQNQSLADEKQQLVSERDDLRQQLVDARKAVTILPGLADEKAALEERLEAVGAQLVKAQQEVDTLQRENADATSRALSSKQTAEQIQGQLATLQDRASDAEKAARSHNISVAELTEANAKLEADRSDLRKQLAVLRADNTRLGQTATSIEQLKAEADRSAQQNIDTLSAQLTQAQRDLQSARDANSRLVEGNVNQERDRAASLAQLRQENSALLARLTQAQGTLDQIASAARLGTPASTLASGGTVNVRPPSTPTTSQAAIRYHTVIEGDSLSRISMLYYGTAGRWQEIYQGNLDVLQGSSALRVGMQLRIP